MQRVLGCRVHWDALTIQLIERRSDTHGTPSLYCAACGKFHDTDSFSTPQQQQPTRHCLLGRPRGWPDTATMPLSDAARHDGARRAGYTIIDAPADHLDAATLRASRAAKRGPPGPLGPADVGRRAPRRAKRMATRASRPAEPRPRMSEAARLNALWSSSAGYVQTKCPPRRPKGRGRRQAGAVLLPPCKRRKDMLAELDQLLLAGVRREARGRKLHLDRKV